VLLATGFGAGYLPITPGSWASLGALPVAWAIVRTWGVSGLAAAVGLAFAVGWWAAATITKVCVTEDPGAIVIDEVAGQWLVLVATPLDPLAYVVALLLFRIFDILKPWPVRWADRHVKGGLGIMLDDLLAAVYAILVLSILLPIGEVTGVRS
jgi:phosphatidylglycerophosphatase A